MAMDGLQVIVYLEDTLIEHVQEYSVASPVEESGRILELLESR